MTTIEDIATIVRSKNAGPFQLTLDIFFPSREAYQRVLDAETISDETISQAYSIEPNDIIGIYGLDRLNAIKVSIVRPVPAGSITDSDVYGAQQHTPLLSLEVREDQ